MSLAAIAPPLTTATPNDVPLLSAKSIPIVSIQVGRRFRKHLGDIKALAASIEKVGLLHPIVIGPEMNLIVGQRRLEAFRQLGRDAIPASVADDLTELSQLLQAEADENTCRLALNPLEAVAQGEAIEKAYKPVAEAAQKQHGNTAPGKKSLRGNSPKCSESARTTAVAARAVGLDRRTYERAKIVAHSGSEKAMGVMARTGKVNGAYRILKVEQQAAAIAKEPPPLPEGPFRTIVVDPPWQYDSRGDDPTHRGVCDYPCLTTDQIASMPVAGRAHEHAILWLWTTNAFLRQAFDIAAAWGFTYKTMLTWVKDRMGTGNWLRNVTEHCLLCVRGKPTIILSNQTTIIHGATRRHSEKPEEFYRLVEELCPGSKLKMFSRQRRKGWTGYGDEAGDQDEAGEAFEQDIARTFERIDNSVEARS